MATWLHALHVGAAAGPAYFVHPAGHHGNITINVGRNGEQCPATIQTSILAQMEARVPAMFGQVSRLMAAPSCPVFADGTAAVVPGVYVPGRFVAHFAWHQDWLPPNKTIGGRVRGPIVVLDCTGCRYPRVDRAHFDEIRRAIEASPLFDATDDSECVTDACMPRTARRWNAI